MESIIDIVKYILLGLFQGFSEPIPISSSGHLVIAQHIFGLKVKGLHFELLMNTASFLAVVYIYKKSISDIASGSYKYMRGDKGRSADFKFALFLILATIPAGLIGVLFEDQIARHFKGLIVIGAALLVTAIALFLIRKMKGVKGEAEITWKDALIIGISQSVALIPGISRSGSTVVAAMALGLKQETALKFSFLLYIPISVGGFVLGMKGLLASPEVVDMVIPYTLAFIATFFMTVLSLRWFMNVMKSGNLIYFSVYCFIAGAGVIVWGLI